MHNPKFEIEYKTNKTCLSCGTILTFRGRKHVHGGWLGYYWCESCQKKLNEAVIADSDIKDKNWVVMP